MIAIHAFLGPVTADDWNLVFNPPGGRAGIAYTARFSKDPTLADYEALGPRLSAFEVFCRNLETHDSRVREHFQTWPASAGAFELVGVMMSGDEHPLPWALEPGCPYAPGAPAYRPFALQYLARDQQAWEMAEIPWFPPQFVALFDEAGRFSGIDHDVERGMRSLPETITPSRWEAGYRHPFFGRRKLSELSTIGKADIADRKVPIDLYMRKQTMLAFEPEQLDAFVPLVENLAALDATVRAAFPEDVRKDWLEERFAYGSPAQRAALGKAFPGASSPADVTPAAFASALVLDRACFSLSPEDSGGAVLTLDYLVLPKRHDDERFAAKFDASGALMGVVLES